MDELGARGDALHASRVAQERLIQVVGSHREKVRVVERLLFFFQVLRDRIDGRVGAVLRRKDSNDLGATEFFVVAAMGRYVDFHGALLVLG